MANRRNPSQNTLPIRRCGRTPAIRVGIHTTRINAGGCGNYRIGRGKSDHLICYTTSEGGISGRFSKA
jgi:hypothetical protein